MVTMLFLQLSFTIQTKTIVDFAFALYPITGMTKRAFLNMQSENASIGARKANGHYLRYKNLLKHVILEYFS